MMLPVWSFAQKSTMFRNYASDDAAPVADGRKYGLGLGDLGIAGTYDVNNKITAYASAGWGYLSHTANLSGWYRFKNFERSDAYAVARVYIGGELTVGAGAGLEWSWGKLLKSNSDLVKSLYSNTDLIFATGGHGLVLSGSLRYRFGK